MALLPALPAAAQSPEASGPWRLEFGPWVGHYDFDRLTRFEDRFVFGLRLGARRSELFQIEAEFGEVYTSREVTSNAARQISLALHGRLSPLVDGPVSPTLLAGMAFVALDDERDPDSFGEAWDLGLGVVWRANGRWRVRADFLLRYQRFTLFDPAQEGTMEPVGDVRGLWARQWSVGVFHVF
jgi:hypothetical protein